MASNICKPSASYFASDVQLQDDVTLKKWQEDARVVFETEMGASLILPFAKDRQGTLKTLFRRGCTVLLPVCQSPGH